MSRLDAAIAAVLPMATATFFWMSEITVAVGEHFVEEPPLWFWGHELLAVDVWHFWMYVLALCSLMASYRLARRA